jgi:hypothetical protein
VTRDIAPRWVDSVPDQLEPQVLYVCVGYATTAHLCACGCGNEIVAPLSPHDWQLVFDGSVSLYPSIGNWSFPCRSHYWIRSNRIVWAGTWSDDEVAKARERNRRARSKSAPHIEGEQHSQPAPRGKRGWLRRLFS